MKRAIHTTIVNHVAVEIAASPAIVWGEIIEEYVEARKFRNQSYAIVALDDLEAVLGGYRMQLKNEGNLVDDRIIRITERDDSARRLSLFADYLLEPGGLQVYATYHAQKSGAGTRYGIDCHASLCVEVDSDATRASTAAVIATMKTQSDTDLIEYLESVKTRIMDASTHRVG